MSNYDAPLRLEIVEALAKKHGCESRDICIMCGKKIEMQIFRNSGVCSENCRKNRDGDHTPFRGGSLNP